MNPDQFSGDPDDIASAKAALPKLVHGDRMIGALPDDPSKLTAAVLRSTESSEQAERAARAVCVRERVPREVKSWHEYVNEMIEIQRLYGFDALDLYDDTRFDVTELLSVRVDGTKAVADVRAYDMYHYFGERGWVKGQALHHRFTLRRSSTNSGRWYLEDEEQDVDSEYRAMGLTVGAAD